MRERLPERIYYTPADLGSFWGVDVSEIAQWLMHGQLRAHVWLPMMSVHELSEELEGSRIVMTRELRHWEGYTPIFAHQCRSLFKRGEIHLREFARGNGRGRYRLPDSAEDYTLQLADLVILQDERTRFESIHAISKEGGRHSEQTGGFDPTFRNVRINGTEYRFGDIQAKILRLLYNAGASGNPWQNGKQILQEAGSESYTLANVFKRNPAWKRLIVSDGRGRYRASEELLRPANPEGVHRHCPDNRCPPTALEPG